MSVLLEGLKHDKEEGYMALQRKEWEDGATIPTRSHHLFTGVPYHHHVGSVYGASRLSHDIDEGLEASKGVYRRNAARTREELTTPHRRRLAVGRRRVN